MDPFHSNVPSDSHQRFWSHLPAQQQPHIQLQPLAIAHEETASLSVDQMIDQAIATKNEIKLAALISSEDNGLSPHQLFRICQYNPSTFVPLIARRYAVTMPELLLHIPQEELRSSPDCIRECIKHGARVDIAKEDQLTAFSLFCSEPTLHEIVKDIINGDLVQTSQTTSPKRPSEEPSPHAKRQRVTEQKDGPHAEDIGSKELVNTRNKGEKKRTDDEEVTTSRMFTTGEAPQYLVDGLCEAIRAGNDKAVAYFLLHRAILLGAPSNTEETIADIAIQSNNILCIKRLVEADIDLSPHSLWNMLRWAILENQQELLEAALVYLENRPTLHQSTLNLQDENGTLLHYLVNSRTPHMASLMMRLLKLDADPMIEDSEGNTIFHLLAAASDENPDIRQLLIDLTNKDKDSVNVQSGAEETILHILLDNESPDVDLIRHLLELDVDLSLQDYNGDTIFHLLAYKSNNNPDVRQLLIDLTNKHKESVNVQSGAEETILHILLDNKPTDVELIRYLLALGADPSLQNNNGNTIFHLLASLSQEVPILLLFKELIKTHSSNLAVTSKYNDLETRNRAGKTVLLMAASKGGAEAVQQLIDVGASISAVDNYGNTLLHHAVIGENPDIIGFALSHFSVDTFNKQGETPLQFWLRKRPNTENVECFNLLIQKGPDLNLLPPKQLAVCVSLMDGNQFKKYESLLQNKLDLYNQLPAQNDETRFFKKFFLRYKKIFLRQAAPVLRSRFQGGIRVLSSPEDCNRLKTELGNWLEELERLRLLIQSQPLGYLESDKSHVDDAKWLCKKIIRELGQKRYEILVAEDRTGTQAISVVNLHPDDYFVEYLMTRPRNLPLRGSKRAVSRAPTSLLQEVAKRTLADGEKGFYLDSTDMADSFYRALGFTKGTKHQYTIEGKALKKLAEG